MNKEKVMDDIRISKDVSFLKGYFGISVMVPRDEREYLIEDLIDRTLDEATKIMNSGVGHIPQ